jgi:hypothetical protein
MSYAYDLFISYAHIDNQPVTADRKGWVTQFHESLSTFLSQLKGSEARIWRDSKLQGNDLLSDEILAQFAQTAVLVSVLTPSFLNSDWCTREVAEFCRRADDRGGIVVGNKTRIFKVEKTPVKSQHSLPAWMRDAIGYQFYVEVEGRNLELEPSYGEEYAQRFRLRVRLLAEDIVKLLEALAAEAGKATRPTPAAKASIYLAECSGYQWDNRKLLERELLRQGYAVLPDRALPPHEEQYASEVRRMLEQCTLAIHLVDEHHDPVLIGPNQKSAVMLQNALAAERSRTAHLSRLIWLPKDTSSDDEQHEAFIEALDRDSGAQFGADLIRGNIEELKASIRDALKTLAAPSPQRSATNAAATVVSAPRLLYVICDERDVKATVPIRKFLRKSGYDIEIPVFEGNATRVRKENQQLLDRCEGVILFYGAGEELWKRTMDGELKKLKGRRGGHSFVPVLVYLADPWTSAKQDLLDMESPAVIDGRGDDSETALNSFLRSIMQLGAAQ